MFSTSNLSANYFIWAFVFKLLTGIIFLWIYTNYYPNREEADVFKYYDDAIVLNSVYEKSESDYFSLLTGIGDIDALTKKYLQKSKYWDSSPTLSFLNDNRIIIRFNSVLLTFSSGNIYLHLLVAVIISFTGLTFLFLYFYELNLVNAKILFAIIFFTPSLLFWTSSILKENFLILGLGIFLWSVHKISKHQLGPILLSLFSLLLVAFSKLYVLIALIPALLAFQWNNNKNDGKSLVRYMVTFALFAGLILNLDYFFPSYNILSILATKQSEFICLAEWTGARSVVFIPELSSNLISFVKSAPYALYNSLLRPLPWDYSNFLSVPAIFEIMIIILLAVSGILFFKKPEGRISNFILFSVGFIINMSLLIGWTSPVLGAIVRYRIVILPFLIIVLVSIIDGSQLKTALNKFKLK